MGGFLSHLKPAVNPEVLEASCGPIRGNIYKHEERIIDGYLGIPFAEAPRRFQRPIAAKVWMEAKECTEYGAGCPQAGVFENMKKELGLKFDEENCLFLNVFSPRWKSEEFSNGFPVMVNIFGGGFEMGTAAAYDAYSISGTLPLKEVVVVTVNYRVGILGFFTTGDDVCRGNFGLWDQTLALEWVQKHIASFGGDPKNVTVFGCSAGGVSADLLTLSPHSRDLFQKCIAMSGTADCEMGCRSREVQAGIFKEFAASNGYTGSDSIQLLEWYQKQSVEVLNTINTFKFSASGFMSCAPNLDGDFFTDSLRKLREEAPKKQFMMGGTEFEGLLMAIPDPVYSRIGNNIEESAKKLFGSDVVENSETVVRTLREKYLEGVIDSDESAVRKRFIEFLGDAVFSIGILKSAEAAARRANDVYLYSFEYCNPDGFGPLVGLLDFKASTHGNDFRYVMGDGGFEKFAPTEQEFKVMDFMASIYTNFAKFGDPNGNKEHKNWQVYNLEHSRRYFKIDNPKSEMRNNFRNGRLWILEDVNRIPIEF